MKNLGIKEKGVEIRNNAANAAQNLAEDINCLLGKCKNKEQENNLNKERENMSNRGDIESKQLINDPNIKMDIPQDKKDNSHNDDMNIKESGGAGVNL
jgi:hypothetical protein